MIKRKLVLLGSTGSVGQQTLEVIDQTSIATIYCLSCHQQIDLLEKQIKKYQPAYAIVTDIDAFKKISKKRLTHTTIVHEIDALQDILDTKDSIIVLNAIVGIAGFLPSYYTVAAKKDLALANKESLVVGGQIIMPLAAKNKVHVLPVDSEHSAIYQCLMGNDINTVGSITLTASGGPFRKFTNKELDTVTLQAALAHPTYLMGPKITIDSSTLMNKAFEIIEAHFLFGIPMKDIDVLVHPESIVHSLVTFVDGSIMAQLGEPDMKLPIQLALSLPKRLNNQFTHLLLTKQPLHFEDVNPIFTSIDMAYAVMKIGGLLPTVFNGANEMLVQLFIEEKIKFTDILRGIQKALDAFENNQISVTDSTDIDHIIKTNQWARDFISGLYA